MVNKTLDRGEITREYITLEYATPRTPTQVTVEFLYPPTCTSSRPCPLFMTQTNHRRWALVGLTRGYATVVYPGADSNDQTDPFRLAYPNATWGLIRRRAWLASRVLDYFVKVDVVNASQVAVTGHSRNGKQSMIAAAFDNRFTAVISSSSGVPAMSPYRFTSAFTFSESPSSSWPNPPNSVNCSCTRSPDHRPAVDECCWWLPSVSSYEGRENEIPIDSHGLVGLIAPRHLLSECAWNDPCDPTFAVEQTYRAGMEVYAFLDASTRLRIRYRPGEHHGMESLPTYFDWFDEAFERSASGLFPETLLHAFDWTTWNRSASRPPMPGPRVPVQIFAEWLMGDAPSGPAWSPGGSYAVSYHSYVNEMMGRGCELYRVVDGVAQMTVNFGRYVYGNVYYPASYSGKAIAAIVWLHPYSYQGGYTENYSHDSKRMYVELARQGFLVLAFDQIGFGERLRDGLPVDFYRRYPNWSLLGYMVQDVISAVDFLTSDPNGIHPDGLPLSDFYNSKLPPIDANRIYAVGYAMGGVVALHAALFETRLAGVASLAGFTPFRNATLELETGGNRRLYDWHALLPRLGWFAGRESDVPYDYDNLLAGLGFVKTKVYVLSPLGDRTANQWAIRKSVNEALSMSPELELTFDEPSGINQLNDDMQKGLLNWLKKINNDS